MQLPYSTTKIECIVRYRCSIGAR